MHFYNNLMDVSIIIPVHKPDKNILKRIRLAIDLQKFSGRKEVLLESGGGLSENINSGIEKARYPIIVTIHQDSIPVGRNWLSKLTAPLKNKSYAASVSDVELPKELWNRFGLIAKILSVKELKVITPLLDEKGCAYRKEALIEAGLFNSKTFRSAGEDFAMYLELCKIGKIAYPHTKIIHYHFHTWRNRFGKEIQLANAFGALVRIYGRKMPLWYRGFLKATPLVGWPFFFGGIQFSKLGKIAVLSPIVLLLAHVLYIIGFWKGFLRGNQTL